jgi:23S rRNA (uracil1939-C5)-methyltransferase
MSDVRELVIARVGAQGDGVAEGQDGPIFVPFTLAGERVLADVSGERGHLLEILEASDLRAKPICMHFGVCGGCSVQHMVPEAYRDWKRGLVVSAFRSRGLNVEVAPLMVPEGKRRRAIFTAERTEAGIAIGFHEMASHALVAIKECPVLEPKIVAALPVIRTLLEPLLSKRGEARVTVTLTDSGLDMQIDGSDRGLSPDLLSQLASQAGVSGLARLAVGDDIVYQSAHPTLSFGAANVALPAGAFVQAVAAAEHEIARMIVAAVGKAKRVADLFCGLGAFTFPLAAKMRVASFDGDRAAIEALQAAAKRASGLKPIDARVRDLFRDPLSRTELNEFDAVVFDPPRAGAESQAKRLAQSKVKVVVAVSCNPATLARDARHLIDGGYRIESVTPIDQFVYSAHVEIVAVFRR